ncbi:MAG: cytochrome c oxidase accessory protein CcoG [Hyphomicrobiaceae bacterium]
MTAASEKARQASESAAVDRFIRPGPAGDNGEAAPGIERVDVQAVKAAGAPATLYGDRVKIHPKRVYGFYRNIKWVVMIVALAVYYGLPWLRWDRGPALPDQAVLLDFANQRLFFGPLEIWAQEFYYVTGILVISSLALFLVTALAGRVWCGYACPQTVWTDLFVWVERFVQGDRNQRIKLEKAPWSFEKFRKIALTHVIWLLISAATGGALVFYFRDAPTLAVEMATGTAPSVAYVFLGVFTVTTYLLGGIAREQVCIYMCPWPRIQGAMFDDHSLLVSYRTHRGEPRGAHKKGDTWEGRGDCIDCKQCVVVCPMGIDIREGPQLACIQCALCIDACNAIMDKVGRPRGLIAYDTFENLEAAKTGGAAPIQLLRPRTLLYVVLIPIVLALMVYGWLHRAVLEVNVLRDRNPLFVNLSDGGVRNGYDVKVLNKRHDTRRVVISVEGLPAAAGTPVMDVVGLGAKAADGIDVAPDNLRALRVYLTVPSAGLKALRSDATPITFVVKDLGDGTMTRRTSNFRSPKQ